MHERNTDNSSLTSKYDFNRARQQLELQRQHYGGGARIEVNGDALNTLMFQRDLTWLISDRARTSNNLLV